MPATEQDAFSTALLDFLRATRRMRGRLGDSVELSLSQYHLPEPLIGGERREAPRLLERLTEAVEGLR